MPSLRTDKGRLFIDFIYRGERCRESLHLSDNRENRIVARQLVRQIEAELVLGAFDHAETFLRRKKAGKFGRKARYSDAREFARNWLESRRPSLKPATFLRLHQVTLRSHPAIELGDDADQHYSAQRHSVERGARQEAHRVRAEETRTAAHEFGAGLYGIFAAAIEDGIISENPVARIDRLREPVPDVDPLTFAETGWLLTEANEWERSLLTVLCLRRTASQRSSGAPLGRPRL
jgi:hypothetical protein